MITLHSYWQDRESKYRIECTEVIQRNAMETVSRVNHLLAIAEVAGIARSYVSSGWRPNSVNDATANAAKGSNHLTAKACDLADADRALAQWCVSNPDKLAQCELWMEDPRWTPTWVHLQTVPPKSGKRIYVPSSKPPLAAPLEGQKVIPTVVIV